MAELPSMDDILRDSKKREKRGLLTVGLLVAGAGLGLMVCLYAIDMPRSTGLYWLPRVALGVGVAMVVRAFTSSYG